MKLKSSQNQKFYQILLHEVLVIMEEEMLSDLYIISWAYKTCIPLDSIMQP